MARTTLVLAAAAVAAWILFTPSTAPLPRAAEEGHIRIAGPSAVAGPETTWARAPLMADIPAGHPVALHSSPSSAFVKPDGAPLQLHALNMIPVWRHSLGRTWASWHYRQIARKGFNAVRFVLYWSALEPRVGTFDRAALATLDTAVARARKAGLYVILDAIHLWGPNGMSYVPGWARTGDSVDTVSTKGGRYVEMLATRYADDPAVAGLDLVSEFYRHPIDQNAVLRVYARLIARVRRAAPRKIVLIEPTYGDSSVAGALADFANLPERRNVVWSIHDFFAGGSADGYSGDGRQRGSYTWNGTTGYSHPSRRELANHLVVQLRAAHHAGLPMWIGEFGIGSGTPNHDRWISDQLALFARYGLGWAWWGYGTNDRFNATNDSYAWRPWTRLLAERHR